MTALLLRPTSNVVEVLVQKVHGRPASSPTASAFGSIRPDALFAACTAAARISIVATLRFRSFSTHSALVPHFEGGWRDHCREAVIAASEKTLSRSTCSSR